MRGGVRRREGSVSEAGSLTPAPWITMACEQCTCCSSALAACSRTGSVDGLLRLQGACCGSASQCKLLPATQISSGALMACAPILRVGAVAGTPCASPFMFKGMNRTDCVSADGVEACKASGGGRAGRQQLASMMREGAGHGFAVHAAGTLRLLLRAPLCCALLLPLRAPACCALLPTLRPWTGTGRSAAPCSPRPSPSRQMG